MEKSSVSSTLNFTPDDLETIYLSATAGEPGGGANAFYGIISAGCREHGKSKDSRRSST